MLTATGPEGTTTMTYDAADRLTEVDYPDGRVLEYSYDSAAGWTQSDQDGFIVNYAYDAAGRLQNLTDGSGGPIVQLCVRQRRPTAAPGQWQRYFTTYAYDPAGRVAAPRQFRSRRRGSIRGSTTPTTPSADAPA